MVSTKSPMAAQGSMSVGARKFGVSPMVGGEAPLSDAMHLTKLLIKLSSKNSARTQATG